MLTIIILTLLLYCTAIFGSFLELRGSFSHTRFWLLLAGFSAILLHSFLLYKWIDIQSGQNLNFYNMFSLVSWLISFLTLGLILFKPLETLVLFVFPITISSILLAWIFPHQVMFYTASQPKTLFHILFSLFTFCLLAVAGLLAVLLTLQNYFLRYKHVNQLTQKLPPLENMETLLFKVLTIGFILLTMVLISSIYFYHLIIWQQPLLLMQKMIEAVIAWFIFAILLLGRYLRGWRGRQIIHYTLGGVLLLVIVNFRFGIF